MEFSDGIYWYIVRGYNSSQWYLNETDLDDLQRMGYEFRQAATTTGYRWPYYKRRVLLHKHWTFERAVNGVMAMQAGAN